MNSQNDASDVAPAALNRGPVSTRLRLLLGLSAPLLIAAATAALDRTSFLAQLENGSIDARCRHRGPLKPDPRVLIVGVDESGLRELAAHESHSDARNAQPNLRAYLPAAIDNLWQAGALCIGLDFVLQGESDPDIDQRLADACHNAWVVGGMSYTEGIEKRAARVFVDQGLVEALVSVQADPGGALRRIPDLTRLDVNFDPETGEREFVPLLAFTLAAFADPDWNPEVQPSLPLQFDADGNAHVLGQTVEKGLINFAAGPGQGFSTLRFADVVLDRFDHAVVEDTIPIIGEVRSTADQFAMPFTQNPAPGVYFHANLLNQILANIPLSQWPATPTGRTGFVALFSLVSGWYFWNLRAWWGHRGAWLLLAGYIGVGLAVFLLGWWWSCQFAYQRRVVLPMIAPMVGTGLAAMSGVCAQAAVTAISARRFAQRNQFVEQLFGRSVSAVMLQAIKKDPQRVAAIEDRDVSVLFCDIRGFTKTADKLAPAQVADLLNEYFETISAAVFERKGFIDKFVGDELMAVFGVPLDDAEHVTHAVDAAIGIKHKLGELNRRRVARDEPAIDCGIGVHCGPAAAGYIGSGQRANYTVVGDTVNIASRIEGETTQGEVLISEAVHTRLSDAVPRTHFKEVELKGSSRTHALYRLTDV